MPSGLNIYYKDLRLCARRASSTLACTHGTESSMQKRCAVGASSAVCLWELSKKQKYRFFRQIRQSICPQGSDACTMFATACSMSVHTYWQRKYSDRISWRGVVGGQSWKIENLPTFLKQIFQSVCEVQEGFLACKHTVDLAAIHLRPGGGFPGE